MRILYNNLKNLKNKFKKLRENNPIREMLIVDLLLSIYVAIATVYFFNWYNGFDGIILSLFSTMAQVQAGFFAIIISILFITSQLATQHYGKKIMYLFLGDKLINKILLSFTLSILFDVSLMGIIPFSNLVSSTIYGISFGTALIFISLVFTSFNLSVISTYTWHLFKKMESWHIGEEYLKDMSFDVVENEVLEISSNEYWAIFSKISLLIETMILHDNDDIIGLLRKLNRKYEELEKIFYHVYSFNGSEYIKFVFTFLNIYFGGIRYAIGINNEKYVYYLCNNMIFSLNILQKRNLLLNKVAYSEFSELFQNAMLRIKNYGMDVEDTKYSIIKLLIKFYEILVDFIIISYRKNSIIDEMYYDCSLCIIKITDMFFMKNLDYHYLLNPYISRLSYYTAKLIINSNPTTKKNILFVTRAYSSGLLQLIYSKHLRSKDLNAYLWADVNEATKYYILQAIYDFESIIETKIYISILIRIGTISPVIKAINDIFDKKEILFKVDTYETSELTGYNLLNRSETLKLIKNDHIVPTRHIILDEEKIQKFNELIDELQDILKNNENRYVKNKVSTELIRFDE
ncbi:hypothetical protein HNP93_000900 [Methanococcus maripaludis]|uniref:Uncharacterized protein n=1 Tax=Methanococcus maripaludis TaxID=39152 RepID=A0A7J9P9W9_METMI|nr:hypothetical protein [Methanococcus maripaludis]MBA2858199.1 hypothetical protein [Methanococcus maripaludis]